MSPYISHKISLSLMEVGVRFHLDISPLSLSIFPINGSYLT